MVWGPKQRAPHDNLACRRYDRLMITGKPERSEGPFRAEHIRCGDPWELSHGEPVRVMPTGGRGADAVSAGAVALRTDPAVREAGVDAGYSPDPKTLRAPDIAIGNVPAEPGWIEGVPPLAVEYADTGQDETELRKKIADLLEGGTRWIWVVRLSGARRVEVHEPGRPMRMVLPGERLEAPGVLQNAVPVEALYDSSVSLEVGLTNLLQRKGYRDLADVRQEGRAEGEAKGRAEGEAKGRAEALLAVLGARGMLVSEPLRSRIDACTDVPTLDRWIARAATAASVADVFGAL
jgi:Uma2 family endonuclease